MNAQKWFDEVYIPHTLEYTHQNETYADRIMFAYKSGQESAAEIAALRAELEKTEDAMIAATSEVHGLGNQLDRAEAELERVRAALSEIQELAENELGEWVSVQPLFLPEDKLEWRAVANICEAALQPETPAPEKDETK